MAAMSLNDDADASWCSPADTTSHSKIAAIYLGKFEREIERFTAARDDVEARIDHAFNIVVTAWHLCDWVFCGFKKPTDLPPKCDWMRASCLASLSVDDSVKERPPTIICAGLADRASDS